MSGRVQTSFIRSRSEAFGQATKPTLNCLTGFRRVTIGRKLCVVVADLYDEAEDDDAGRADHGPEPGEGRQLFGGVTVDGGRLCDAHYHDV